MKLGPHEASESTSGKGNQAQRKPSHRVKRQNDEHISHSAYPGSGPLGSQW
ncbi:MAG: hypothetical protein BWY17_03773 [Deltaproteobacteria bacterium ADurb.Bin207]|jgi:hypothetical protein|nr:MAG: hypothetical protein BWY17_03773 [Deltaproteobacteria bacterium ADurb.Bin207]